MKALADNLYFKNLDNNAGVFHHLVDAAEEEECKEAILAFYFLLISDQAKTREELDLQIESWFSDTFNFDIDFEIEDALDKLMRFGIVTFENNQYRAVSLNEAHIKMDQQWDSIFS